MRLGGTRKAKVLGWVIVVLAIALPCVRLWPLGDEFYCDWMNHEWIIGYYGSYLRAHHAMPLVLNTTTALGIMIPVFYGTLLYPVLAVFSALLSPGLVLRLAGILMFALQFGIVSRALQRLTVPRYLAQSIACLVIWEIYPLTNYYNRAALVEFFATSLLVCALGALILLFHATSARERTRYAAGAMLAFTLATGSHPITAIYAGPLFVVSIPLFWWLLRDDPARRRAIVRSLLPWIALAALCVTPWLIVAQQYASHLAISAMSQHVLVLDGWDDFWNRFYPIPHDPRVIPGAPLNMAGTPYLDAQVSLSLLLAFVAVSGIAISAAASGRRAVIGVAALAVGMFVVFSWLSVTSAGYDLLPKAFSMIQFVYRAVTYQNLASLLGIFLVIMMLRRSRGDATVEILRSRALAGIVAVALVGAAVGVVIKWGHIAAIETSTGKHRMFETAALQRSYIKLPPTYYALDTYTTGFYQAEAIPESAYGKVWTEKLKVGTGKAFGEPLPLKLDYPTPTWVMTNVLAFPWNRIRVDGQFVPTRVHFEQLTFEVPAGPHEVTAEVAAPLMWRILHTVAVLAVMLWCVFMIVLSVPRRWRAEPSSS